MKVVQINVVYKKGSTGKIVYDLHSEFLKHGIESIVFYGRGEKVKEANVYKCSTEIESKINALKSRITGLQYNGSIFATRKLINQIKFESPDIVHLHCLNGYFVNIYKLLYFLKKSKIPTVLTLHAEFMYTGSCGHALECLKWSSESGCSSCPILFEATKSYFFDRTQLAWKKMKKSFEGFDLLSVVSVSPWLVDRASVSPILKDKKHKVVFNGIETELIFKPTETKALKQKYNLKDEKILLHVTSSLSSAIKGGKYLLELARRFEKENVKVIVVGDNDVPLDLPINIVNAGKIFDPKELAAYYSLADLTILTSQRETFSMVCAESLACGTPIVGFKAGAPEQISLKNYSKFVNFGELDELEYEIRQWLSFKNQLGNELVEEAQAYYSKTGMYRAYKDIYDGVLGES